MKVNAPTLFPRLRLQSQIQALVREHGEQVAWQIVEHAIRLELGAKYPHADRIHQKEKAPGP